MSIRTALMQLIDSKNFTQPIAWPGINFTPPNQGAWLEVRISENQPIQDGLANDAPIMKRGILQITATTRPGVGFIGLESVANAVIAAFPKGSKIGNYAKVTKTPYALSDITADDKLMIPVVIEYGP